MSENSNKRIILPNKHSQVSSSQIVSPTIDHLIANAKGIISMELTKYALKVSRGQTLTVQEARVVQGYMKCLVDISKEMRDTINDADLANMTNEELADLLRKLTNRENNK